MQRRNERLPFHPGRVGVPACGEQLLELVDHQDQPRWSGCGIGWAAQLGVHTAAGGGSHRELGQHRRLARRSRQGPVHRSRIRARNVG